MEKFRIQKLAMPVYERRFSNYMAHLKTIHDLVCNESQTELAETKVERERNPKNTGRIENIIVPPEPEGWRASEVAFDAANLKSAVMM